jgi:NADH-quinone oxidoreductase subunit L
MENLVIGLLFFPLLGVVFNLFLKYVLKKQMPLFTGYAATIAITGSFFCSVLLFWNLSHLISFTGEIYSILNLGTWISLPSVGSNSIHIPLDFRIDKLSCIMTMVITGVGALIHLFSTDYMKEDPSYTRYFVYLNLFCFFMLCLVLADAFPILFFGWEGVGLCSYLLIGFWFTDGEKPKAATKAFIMNRVGDFFLLLGIFIIFMYMGTMQFSQINQWDLSQHLASGQALMFAALFLFFGACGKSAQFPLYTWLPDAMAGPTPVSALIHAATMVTAGIYLLVRLSPFFSQFPEVMNFVAIIGLITSLLAATMALVQSDLKKVMAYSTVSQLGLMFLACGVGAYTTALFHLVTHAFFKALLFLGAGSVIHGVHGEQDMRKMGGLSKYMPITCATMLVGTLGLSGIFPFAGFFSKDEILYATLAAAHKEIFYLVAQIVSVLTAFYSARMMAMTFYGTNEGSTEKPHESSLMMLIPLIVLALLTTFGGFLGLPHYMAEGSHFIQNFVSASVQFKEFPEVVPLGFSEWQISLVALGLGICFYMLGFSSYLKQRLHVFPKLCTDLWENLYYVDVIYHHALVLPLKWMTSKVLRFIDFYLIEGIGKVTSMSLQWSSVAMKKCQTGNVQDYLVSLIMSVLIVLLCLATIK